MRRQSSRATGGSSWTCADFALGARPVNGRVSASRSVGSLAVSCKVLPKLVRGCTGQRNGTSPTRLRIRMSRFGRKLDLNGGQLRCHRSLADRTAALRVASRVLPLRVWLICRLALDDRACCACLPRVECVPGPVAAHPRQRVRRALRGQGRPLARRATLLHSLLVARTQRSSEAATQGARRVFRRPRCSPPPAPSAQH